MVFVLEFLLGVIQLVKKLKNMNLFYYLLGSILGDVFMQGFNIHFDRQNKQIGFAKVSNCSGI